MEIKIDRFKKKHASMIHDLFPKDWDFDFLKFVNRYFNYPGFVGFSIFSRNNIVGFGNLFIFDNIGWIGNIIIKEEYRKRGIGSKITTFLIEYGGNFGGLVGKKS